MSDKKEKKPKMKVVDEPTKEETPVEEAAPVEGVDVLVTEEPKEEKPKKSKSSPKSEPATSNTSSSSSASSMASDQPRKIVFTNGQSPGDIVCMTSAIRDLFRMYEDYEKDPKGKKRPALWPKPIVDCQTSCGEIWENNPYLTKLNKDDHDVEVMSLDNELIHRSNQGPYHFTESFTRRLEEIFDLDIPDRIIAGDLHISDAEKGWYSQVFDEMKADLPYWIVVNGGKQDYTAKHWHPHRMQEVVDYFPEIMWVQVGEGSHMHHVLQGNNVLNLIGKTDLRQLIRLVYNASGVICPVTSLMHFAAGVPVRRERTYGLANRPCVVIAGGREPMRWECYPNHAYLHTCGMLHCCDNGGCWKSRIMPLGDGDSKDNDLCLMPVKAENGIIVPRCMDMITSGMVIDAVKKYISSAR